MVEEKQKEEEEIVLKVDIHCEGCARKIARALKCLQGVEGIMMDYKTSKVVVIGKNVDPLKVCEMARKKSGGKVELISHQAITKEEEIKKEEEPKEERIHERPPPEITVVLNVQMHCDACAQVLQKQISKIKGVECVTTDLEKNQVIIKGVNIDPEKLANDVYKRCGKQVSVVNNIEEKKQEEEVEEKKQEEEVEEIMENYNLAQKYNNNNNMEYYANYSP